MLKKLNNKKGFTLMEMLIVVAIIAVLIAIAIPTFTSQLEKSREATDAANIRAAYAECAASMVSDTNASTKGYSKSVALVQTQDKFTTLSDDAKIGDVTLSGLSADVIGKGKTVYVNYSAEGKCTITATKAEGFADVPTS